MKLSFPLPVVGMLVCLWLAGCNGCQPNIPPSSPTTASTSIVVKNHPGNSNVDGSNCNMPNWNLTDTDYQVVVQVWSAEEDPSAPGGYDIEIDRTVVRNKNQWQASTAVDVPSGGAYALTVTISLLECSTTDCANTLCDQEDGKSFYSGYQLFTDFVTVSEVELEHTNVECGDC